MLYFIADAEVIADPTDPERLLVVAVQGDGVRYAYDRPFAKKDMAHAEYFARLIAKKGSIEAKFFNYHSG